MNLTTWEQQRINQINYHKIMVNFTIFLVLTWAIHVIVFTKVKG